jgi:hypothetical protein
MMKINRFVINSPFFLFKRHIKFVVFIFTVTSNGQ